MKKLSIFLIVLLGFVSQGCVSSQPISEKSSFILWKSSQFKYADMGFISERSDGIKVEIYGSGVALMRLNITKDRICMSSLECMGKREFNRKILSYNYPDDILTNIFESKEIFDGRGIVKKRDGFEQKIFSKGEYDILYKVTKSEMIFEDRYNSILIKVKNL